MAGPLPRLRALDPWTLGLALIGAITLWRLLMAWLVPVTQDEAYYFDWARRLAWGYFDHPPAVALLGIGTRIAPGSALAGRLGGVLAGSLTLVVLARLYLNCGISRGSDLWLALLIVAGTLPGLAGGFLTTPDTVLALGWALALHESERALAGERRRWLTAGLAVGLGLLGKYSMVVMGPVLLWAILRADPRALRTPWPYLGGLLALLVFLPNLIWNLENAWLSLRFQLGHGFATDSGPLVTGADSTLQAAAAIIEHSGPETLAEGALSLLGYLGTQLGLWGLIALAILATPWLARRGNRGSPVSALRGCEKSSRAALSARSRAVSDETYQVDRRGANEHATRRSGRAVDFSQPLSPPGGALLHAATWFPLGLFALVSLVSDVEANWPLMYLLAAPSLLVPLWRGIGPWVAAAALGNLLLVSLYGLHAAIVALPLSDGQNRILRETHGFRELAGIVAGLGEPVYADRYQDTAMLRFYAPGIAASQWPGLTRPSEYLRGRIAPRVEREAITGPFWLLTRGPAAPELPGLPDRRPPSPGRLPRCATGADRRAGLRPAAACLETFPLRA